MNIFEERQRVVAFAQTWIATPYFHCGGGTEAIRGIKGRGVDCARLVAEVMLEAGVVEGVEIPPYSEQWFLHRDDDVFLRIVEQFASQIVSKKPDEPYESWMRNLITPTILPGDLPLFKFGRVVSHAGIVTQWPRVIHAWRESGKVEYGDVHRGEMWARFVGIWRLRRWC